MACAPPAPPSRLGRDLVVPGLLIGGPGFVSEKLTAYEIGDCGQPNPGTALSVSLFYHHHDDLRMVEPAPGGGRPLRLGNGIKGRTWGIETWADYRPQPWWRLSAGFNLLRKDLRPKPGSGDVTAGGSQGNDPDYQAPLRSYFDLAGGIQPDLGLRAVDDLERPDLPGYVAADLRLAWQGTDGLELSLAGINLLDEHHFEVAAAGRPVPRMVHLALRWQP